MQRTISVIGKYVQVDDLVAVGGNESRVVALRELPGLRKRLVFDDGSVLVIRERTTLEVTRGFSLLARVRRWRRAGGPGTVVGAHG
ncbi:hypothetical protein GCM10009716_09670 [Streptomyces sodiiphilus]|uniref:Uncharacterized protein n=2 Tax=Streptomyces sodiiphilus TaxID=226217 RepID=A0ABN2NV54_9ACTN